MSLDDLECLVGERGTVDGDLPAHAPRGMLKRVGHSRGGETFAAPVPEGPTGCREHHSSDLAAGSAGEALQDGRMLTVNGDDFPTAARGGARHELAGHD